MNLQLVYRHILSQSKNENMIKKKKQQQPKRKEKSFPRQESNPGPWSCEVNEVSIAPQKQMLNIVFKFFYPRNSAGEHCLKRVQLNL